MNHCEQKAVLWVQLAAQHTEKDQEQKTVILNTLEFRDYYTENSNDI